MQARIERYEGVSIATSSACSTPDRMDNHWGRQKLARDRRRAQRSGSGSRMTRKLVEMPEPIPTIHLDLSPAAVAPLAHAAAILSQEVVNLYFDALAKADLSKILPAVGRKIVRHNISDLKIDRVERRRRHENWKLAKAFQDLLRGVRESLEQAYLVTEIAWKHHRVKSDSTLYEFITPFKERAAKLMHLSFPYVRIFYERFGKEVELE